MGLLIAALLLAVPLAAAAHPVRQPSRIGIVNEAFAPIHLTVEGFEVGLRETRLAEGRDVLFDTRFTEGNTPGCPASVAVQLVVGDRTPERRRPDSSSSVKEAFP